MAVVLGLQLLVAGQRGPDTGPDPDRETPLPVPSVRTLPRDLDRETARLTAYDAAGRRLTLHYQMTYRDCLVVVVHPQLQQSRSAVTVQLQRVPIRAQQLPTCPKQPVDQVVGITLAQPLGDRSVLDHADGDRPIPRG